MIYRKFQETFTTNQKDDGDVHNKLINEYPQIPDSVFLGFLGILIALQCYVSQYTSFRMPMWAVLLSVTMSLLTLLPMGMITALTGQTLPFNILAQFVIGFGT
jgi:OPT oligopeptide transporter protein